MDDKLTYACRNRRRNMTPAETFLWNAVRRNKTGIKIDRQKAVYLKKDDSEENTSIIADFYSIDNQLIIEINSADSVSRDEYEIDEEKRTILQQQGIKILRFTDTEILSDIDAVIAKIQA